MKLFAGLCVAGTLAVGNCLQVYQIPDTVISGPIDASFSNPPGTVDTLDITPGPNSTSYEFWYLDVISTQPGSSQSIAFNFVLTGNLGLAALGFGGLAPAGAAILGSYANGTSFAATLPTVPKNGASVTITIGPDFIDGVWQGTGLSFTGPLGGGLGLPYTVTVDAPSVGITGVLTLVPIAAPHYACGLDTPGQNELLLPSLGWANAVPDSIAAASFVVNGELFEVEGTGYHDKLWGVVPLTELVSSWYGGHARVGPYSVTWIDGIDISGDEFVTVYVSKSGAVLVGECGPSVAKVRPWGPNSQYPPVSAANPPGGFTLQVQLPQGEFLINMTVQSVITQGATIFERYVGPVSGGVVGKDHYTGTAYFETFAF